ncbi:MAG: hypothetical protein WDO19_31065 [Bacteroidota bacterium]
MKSKNYRKLVIALFASVTLAFINNYPHAQSRKVPTMWVSADKSKEVEKNFRLQSFKPGSYSKAQILNKIIGQTHPFSIRYPIASLIDLFLMMEYQYDDSIKGLNVYLAAFDVEHPGPVSSTNTINKQLVLIFAPTRDTDSTYKFG